MKKLSKSLQFVFAAIALNSGVASATKLTLCLAERDVHVSDRALKVTGDSFIGDCTKIDEILFGWYLKDGYPTGSGTNMARTIYKVKLTTVDVVSEEAFKTILTETVKQQDNAFTALKTQYSSDHEAILKKANAIEQSVVRTINKSFTEALRGEAVEKMKQELKASIRQIVKEEVKAALEQ